MHAKAKIK